MNIVSGLHSIESCSETRREKNCIEKKKYSMKLNASILYIMFWLAVKQWNKTSFPSCWVILGATYWDGNEQGWIEPRIQPIPLLRFEGRRFIDSQILFSFHCKYLGYYKQRSNQPWKGCNSWPKYDSSPDWTTSKQASHEARCMQEVERWRSQRTPSTAYSGLCRICEASCTFGAQK